MKNTLALLLLCSFFLAGCFKSDPPPAPGTASAGDGYALLYSVASQEQNVDKLLWVKDPGEKITAWVKDIAAFNQTVTKQLDAWKKDGTVTNLKHSGLPPAEQEARARATSRTTGELLWSTDIDLRVALVVAQLKAMGYCSDLCYAIGKETSHEDVQKTVGEWQKRFIELNNQGMAILEVGLQTGDQAVTTTKGTEEKVRPPKFPVK